MKKKPQKETKLLATPKQLDLVYKLARRTALPADQLAQEWFHCNADELTMSQAAEFIRTFEDEAR